MNSLKNHFLNEGIKVFKPVNNLKIAEFQSDNNVLLPLDFKKYFESINGSDGLPLNDLYKFYTLDKVNRVFNEFKGWKGIPEYHQLDFQKFKNVFIFGNYEFNFYSFGIELFKEPSYINRVFLFCGKEHKTIAHSFSEFINLYLNEPDKILI